MSLFLETFKRRIAAHVMLVANTNIVQKIHLTKRVSAIALVGGISNGVLSVSCRNVWSCLIRSCFNADCLVSSSCEVSFYETVPWTGLHLFSNVVCFSRTFQIFGKEGGLAVVQHVPSYFPME